MKYGKDTGIKNLANMGNRQKLGNQFVHNGFLSEDQLKSGLKEQQKRIKDGASIKLGELLVEKGSISKDQLETVLDMKALGELTLRGDAVSLAVRLKASFKETDRILMITGLGSRHGTSVVSGEVSIALALMHQKGTVLLIDADFHNSQLYRKFNTPLGPGLEDIILSKAKMEDCVHPTSVSRLSFLPAGSSNTSIISQLFVRGSESLLKQAQSKYSTIVINSSAILENPESVLLASQVDHVALVAEKGRVVKADIKKIRKMMVSLGTNLAGVILSHGK